MSFHDEMHDAIVRIEALEGLPERVATSAAAKIADVLDQQYDLGVDPYGDPWKDLKRGGPSHLQESGVMRSASTVSASGSVIRIVVPEPGGFHQSGTRYMVARPILPTQSKGLPPAYEVAILAAVAEEAA